MHTFNLDHREQKGDHGLSSKAVFYEQSVSIPYIIRPPTRVLEGTVSRTFVEHTALLVTNV